MLERDIECYLSVTEACKYLGLNRNTIHKMIAEDGLPAVKIGKLWKIKIRELEEWIAKNNQKSQEE